MYFVKYDYCLGVSNYNRLLLNMKTFITLAVFISYVEVSMAVQPDKKVPLSSGTSQIVLDTSTLDNPQVFVQQGAKPLFAGQIIGGRTTGSLGEDITPESIKAMTDCGEYEFGGLKCTPNDVVDPCRYCKTRVSKARGKQVSQQLNVYFVTLITLAC